MFIHITILTSTRLISLSYYFYTQHFFSFGICLVWISILFCIFYNRYTVSIDPSRFHIGFAARKYYVDMFSLQFFCIYSIDFLNILPMNLCMHVYIRTKSEYICFDANSHLRRDDRYNNFRASCNLWSWNLFWTAVILGKIFNLIFSIKRFRRFR